MAWPARGPTGQGTLGIHARQDRRFSCTQWRKTGAATRGTVVSRLRPSAALVARIIPLLAHGWPVQALVVALGCDERTVTAWGARAGRQGHAVHEHRGAPPRDLGQGHADARRGKRPGGMVWLARAMMVATRLWLAEEVREQRALPWLR
jgi:hypothetical protein